MSTKFHSNPIRIPDLDSLYDSVRDFIKENQGDKGFICTDNPMCDTIWTFFYSDDYNTPFEFEVNAVRVIGDAIEILFDQASIIYTEEDIANADETDWYDIKDDYHIYYIHTLFSIAESIYEYV